ncbi:MAG TPA: hypothetical protein VLU41_11215 [Ideonella sp.]|nr:hypothetical protein [Ideonella sp.]
MSKNSLVTVIAVLLVVLLAFATNPSPERHRAKIRDAVAERRPIAGALGLGSLRAFTSSYHSLGVASYTTDGERTVSFGAFGMVFVRE